MEKGHSLNKMSLWKRPVSFSFFVLCVYQKKGGMHMKKGLMELVFILNRSGSMGGLESDTMSVL